MTAPVLNPDVFNPEREEELADAMEQDDGNEYWDRMAALIGLGADGANVKRLCINMLRAKLEYDQ